MNACQAPARELVRCPTGAVGRVVARTTAPPDVFGPDAAPACDEADWLVVELPGGLTAHHPAAACQALQSPREGPS